MLFGVWKGEHILHFQLSHAQRICLLDLFLLNRLYADALPTRYLKVPQCPESPPYLLPHTSKHTALNAAYRPEQRPPQHIVHAPDDLWLVFTVASNTTFITQV